MTNPFSPAAFANVKEQPSMATESTTKPITIGSATIGMGFPTYFIADIAANHDGDLSRALSLITLAAEAGADAAKFQHFRATHIVSDYGFRNLGEQLDHQATWSKSVFEVYEDASLPWEWTSSLAAHCASLGIEFMSSPYDFDAVTHLAPYVNAYKIGSGDINWLEELEFIAALGKPVIIATGASTADDVERAMAVLSAAGVPIVLMQCNTNYTGSIDNLEFVNLRVLESFAASYPDVVLGLSDHTPGHVTTLGAVALGARVIEKHFTDDTTRVGPDHGFSLDPVTWRAMVDDTRRLEAALGSGVKVIEANEQKTLIVQRRCVRAAHSLAAGTVLTRDDVVVLRPAPLDAVPAQSVADLVGRTLARDLVAGQHLTWSDV
jgi:N-acetylneuraminate synthase